MRNPLSFLIVTLCLVATQIACSGDINTPVSGDVDTQQPDNDGNDGTVSDQGTTPDPDSGFLLRADNTVVALNEGGDPVQILVSLQRSGSEGATVALAVDTPSPADAEALRWQIDDTSLAPGEHQARITLQLDIGARPLLAHQRQLRITGTDTGGAVDSLTLTLEVSPTTRPDVYLLAGQSNMVGYSETGVRRTAPGEADAPDPRILQLNVTGNDRENFPDAAAFTDPARVAAAEPRFTEALDPLHDGHAGESGKSGTYIGLGLSFAKRALADTTADIVLVPAAWSDTGFCKRDTNIVPGIGWNASARDNAAFSGSLLFDRAVLRTNIVLRETGGILRGILWHQGEADSEDTDCAIAYRDNLRELAQALRSEIDADARGASYRGPAAPVPFIAGTMSKGGGYADFGALKLIVDGAHRTIGESVAYADYVNNDDLVPPDYPCGSGGCIHFGASAYREMGYRYYEALRGVLE